jgi:hypothetical protein
MFVVVGEHNYIHTLREFLACRYECQVVLGTFPLYSWHSHSVSIMVGLGEKYSQYLFLTHSQNKKNCLILKK